jgi:hypothetical protein
MTIFEAMKAAAFGTVFIFGVGVLVVMLMSAIAALPERWSVIVLGVFFGVTIFGLLTVGIYSDGAGQ